MSNRNGFERCASFAGHWTQAVSWTESIELRAGKKNGVAFAGTIA